MRDISEVLKAIESEFDIKVLFACESGSRAWGFPSKDSDYDVRFIYVHRRDWYLSIERGRDVIEVPAHDMLAIPLDPLLDVSGWELTKALRLFRKSNPPLLEWLKSTLVYAENYSTIQQMRELGERIFSPVSSVYHYLNMAKGNYRDFLQGEQVKIKKYFYVLRPILAAKWIEAYGTIPPISFQELVKAVIPDGALKGEIERLLQRKMAGDELNIEPKIDVINDYLNNSIEHLEAYVKSLHMKRHDPTEELDRLFRATLNEVWK